MRQPWVLCLYVILLTACSLGVTGQNSTHTGVTLDDIDPPRKFDLYPQITDKRGLVVELTQEQYFALYIISMERGPIPAEYVNDVVKMVKTIPRPLDRNKLIEYGLLADNLENIPPEERKRRLQQLDEERKRRLHS